MKQEGLSALKKELEQTFGRKIVSYRDCVQMVDDIYRKTDYTVNVNTLRRFFGLVKSNYTASRSTLLILSKYCGFHAPEEIENFAEKQETDNSIQKNEILHYLISLFTHTTIRNPEDDNFNNIIQQTILFLERNPGLIDGFQREIAKTATGQYYYYEKSVNMDRLTSYYGKGLFYYLKAKNTSEAKAFYFSIQVLKEWLTDNPVLIEKHIREIVDINISKCQPHVAGRYFAANIYNANWKQQPIDHIWTEAAQYLTRINKGQNLTDFGEPVYEALVLTNQKTEAEEWATYFHGTIHTIKFIDKPSNNFIKELTSKKSSSKTKHTPDNILTKKYDHLYSLAVNDFTSLNKKSTQRILNELISETGFTWFASDLNK
ncbi:MAG: hypothetical protein ACSLE0_03275 [Chitinophagaceae bacterium]